MPGSLLFTILLGAAPALPATQPTAPRTTAPFISETRTAGEAQPTTGVRAIRPVDRSGAAHDGAGQRRRPRAVRLPGRHRFRTHRHFAPAGHRAWAWRRGARAGPQPAGHRNGRDGQYSATGGGAAGAGGERRADLRSASHGRGGHIGDRFAPCAARGVRFQARRNAAYAGAPGRGKGRGRYDRDPRAVARWPADPDEGDARRHRDFGDHRYGVANVDRQSRANASAEARATQPARTKAQSTSAADERSSSRSPARLARSTWRASGDSTSAAWI